MSIADLLKNSASRVTGVRLSELGETHRKAPYTLDSSRAGFASKVGDFVANVREAMSSPTHVSIDMSAKSLESFIDGHSTLGFKDAMRVELTKRWLMDNQTANDLVGMCSTKEAGFDPSIVNFSMGLVPQFNEKQRDHVACELSGRLLDVDAARDDPHSAMTFVQASRSLSSSMRALQWVAQDMVVLSNHAQINWPQPKVPGVRNQHQLLAEALQERLIELGRSPRETVLKSVAHSADPAVQASVLSTAKVLGQIDKKLQASIEKTCAESLVVVNVGAAPAKPEATSSALER